MGFDFNYRMVFEFPLGMIDEWYKYSELTSRVDFFAEEKVMTTAVRLS